jgi:hypothetical protein
MKQIDNLILSVQTKPTWSSKELVAILNPMKQSIVDQLKSEDKVIINEVPNKKMTVSDIKKYDVIYANTMGMPHYMLVHKVKDGVVHGVIFSSKDKAFHNIHPVAKDRHFTGSYATNSYLAVLEEDAKDKFVRVYENRKEADLIFRLIKEYYKKVLNIR